MLQVRIHLFITKRFTSSTVDHNHSKVFNQLASEWWNIHGFMKALHSMNSIRVPFIINGCLSPEQQNCKEPLNNLKILDVGCGGGILTEALGRLGGTITGIDPNLELIEIAKQHLEKQQNLNKNKISYCAVTIENYAKVTNQKYDVIIASEVIEHINNPDIFLNNCLKCLKPNGSFFITTQNKTIWSKLIVVFLAGKLLRIIPKDIPKYEKFIELNHLQRMLLDRQCKIISICGTWYNPINNKWRICKNTSINYYIHSVKLKI